jgi:hypothetical protein
MQFEGQSSDCPLCTTTTVEKVLAKVPACNLAQLELSLLRILILLLLWHFLAIVANVSLVVYRLLVHVVGNPWVTGA